MPLLELERWRPRARARAESRSLPPAENELPAAGDLHRLHRSTPPPPLAIADVWAAVRVLADAASSLPLHVYRNADARPRAGRRPARSSTCSSGPAPATTQADLVSLADGPPGDLGQRLPGEVPPAAARSSSSACCTPTGSGPSSRAASCGSATRRRTGPQQLLTERRRGPRQGPERRRPHRPQRRHPGRPRARPLRRAGQARARLLRLRRRRRHPAGGCCASAPTPRSSEQDRTQGDDPGRVAAARHPGRSRATRELHADRRASWTTASSSSSAGSPPRRSPRLPDPAAHARRPDRRLADLQQRRAGVDRVRPLLAHAVAAPDRAGDLRRPATSPSSASSSSSRSTACCAPTPKTRAEVYSRALDPITGWMTRDEVRRLEDLPPEPAAPPRRRWRTATVNRACQQRRRARQWQTEHEGTRAAHDRRRRQGHRHPRPDAARLRRRLRRRVRRPGRLPRDGSPPAPSAASWTPTCAALLNHDPSQVLGRTKSARCGSPTSSAACASSSTCPTARWARTSARPSRAATSTAPASAFRSARSRGTATCARSSR